MTAAQAYATGEFPAAGDVVTADDGATFVVLYVAPESVALIPILLFEELRQAPPATLHLIERS